MACLFATGWRSAGRRHRSEAPPPTVGICVLGSASLRGVSVWPRLRRGGPHDRLGHFHLSRTRAHRTGESSPDSTGAQRARVVSAARVVGRCGSHSAALGGGGSQGGEADRAKRADARLELCKRNTREA
jgi:hypothetical protein